MMAKRKMMWVAGAVVLATIVVLAGCSAGSGSAETGRGPARRISAESNQEQYEEGGRGQGRRLSDQASPQFGAGVTSESQETSERGSQQPRLAYEDQFEEKGEIVEISGILSEHDGHWMLATESGEYQLGFGRPDYLESTGIALAKGAAAVIRGHAEEDGELSVVTCETDGGLYTFRTEEGIPLWSGRYRAVTEAAEAESQGRGRSSGGGRGRNG